MTENKAIMIWGDFIYYTIAITPQLLLIKDALYPLDWFAVVIKYGEKMVLSGRVFEEKKYMKSCGCPAFKTNIENKFKATIKQFIMF